MKVISFYTPEYKQEVAELLSTCEKFNLDAKAYPKKSKGSWVHNCTMKAEVILEALDEFKTGVVWVDADARFRNFPSVFQELESYDFGCYWIPNVWNKPHNKHLKPWNRGNEALNGSTLYFNNTQKSIDLIRDWKIESEANPTVWEQQSLQKVWVKHDESALKTFNFNQGYAKVFDAPWFEGEYPLIIEQTQASRRLKRTIK